jgi:hypothetical protein
MGKANSPSLCTHVLCLTIPLAPDEEERDAAELLRSVGAASRVYFAVDEDYEEGWPHKYGAVVRVRGFGVGRALDAASREALKDGCSVVVRTDAHVVFRPRLIVSNALELGYMCTPELCFGASYPDPVTYEFRWTFRPAVVPQTAESVIVWPRGLLERLYRQFGCVYCTEYWGAENYNATLTPCRVYGVCIKTGRFYAIHKYKKTWSERRIRWRRAFAREPWISEALRAGYSPYFAAVEISYAIHLIRHYRNPRVSPKLSEWAYSVAVRYFPQARYVEGADVFEVYKRLGLSSRYKQRN